MSPNTFFEFTPKHIKSPFPANFYQDLELTIGEKRANQEEANKPDLEKPIIATQHESNKDLQEIATEIGEEGEDQQGKKTTESEEGRIPFIQGKIIYGP